MAGSGAFPKVAGDTIFAADYNYLSTRIASVIGVGIGELGYGDTFASTSVIATDIIDGAKWVTLKDDILKARKHQIGAGTAYNTLASTFATLTTKLTTNGKISLADINTFSTTVDAMVTNADTAAASQLTKITGSSRSYSASWNGAITHSGTVTFASAAHARNFFNAGGYIVNDLSSVNSSGSAKDTDWIGILAAGTGATYSAANYRSGTANVIIASETYGSSYGDNYFKAWGERVNDTTIKLTMLFDDASVIGGQIGVPGSGTVFDEQVTLDITSAVNYYKSFDAIVSPVPSSVTTTAFSVPRTDTQTAGTVPGFGGGGGGTSTATVTRGATNVNEGSVVNFTVTSTGIAAGTTLYWTVSRPEDFATSTASFNLSGAGTASFSVTPTADSLTEGTESFTVSIWSGAGGSGTLYDTSTAVTINDTSTGTAPAGVVFTITPTSAPDGSALAIDFSGGTPNGVYDYLYQTDYPGSTQPIGQQPGVFAAWQGQILGQEDAVLDGSGARNIPFHGIGLFPANYRLWVRFYGSGITYRSRDFSVTNNGTVEIPTFNSYSWAYSGLPESAANNISISGVSLNETVDLKMVPRYFNYTSTFFTRSGWALGFPLQNGTSNYTSAITRSAYANMGLTGPGEWVFHIYFRTTGHFRALGVTVT